MCSINEIMDYVEIIICICSFGLNFLLKFILEMNSIRPKLHEISDGKHVGLLLGVTLHY